MRRRDFFGWLAVVPFLRKLPKPSCKAPGEFRNSDWDDGHAYPIAEEFWNSSHIRLMRDGAPPDFTF